MYQSTRDGSIKRSSKEAIVEGIAPDGGLFVKKDLGARKLDLEKICAQDYQKNAADILEVLLEDFSKEELEECLAEAYNNTFDSPEITPLKTVGDHYVLELFHGPTSAFKDVALTLLPQLMQKALKQAGKKALILTATSGDTGKAAMSGFADVKDTAICVFYPYQKVSDIQEKQMVTQSGANVAVAALVGNFDDAQSRVKELFLDEKLNKKADEQGIILSSANSINIGRLVPQIVYYFEAYKQLVQDGKIMPGQEVIYSVPTGNFGDVLAGYFAKELGLPVKKFIVASNANNVLYDFLKTGTYDRNRDFIQTISPSMDILISSNLERLLYYLSNRNEQAVSRWMKDLAEKGSYSVDEDTLKRIQDLFEPSWSDDLKTMQTIREIYEKTGYVLDPHSAVAYRAAMEQDEPVIVLSTASPYKFSRDVLKALEKDVPDEQSAFADLEKLSRINTQSVPAGLAELAQKEVIHNHVITPQEMEQFVSEAMERLL